MEYVLDGIEAGREDIPPAVIAEALGLSADTVRQAISRGFRRLARTAKGEALVDEHWDLPALGQGESTCEDDDDEQS